jgi:predicted aspartyl protease
LRLTGAAAAILLSILTATSAAEVGFPVSLTRGSRLLVSASINGHPVKAILDSAAEATLVSREFAGELNLKGSSKESGQGSGKDSFEAALVNGVTLKVFGVSIPDQTVAVVDLNDVGKRLLGRKLDVILGREIFDSARLSIDIDGRRVTVLQPSETPAGAALKLVTEHAVETVPVRVEGGDEVRATFDLGNGGDVLVGMNLAKRMHWLDDGRSVSTRSGGGLGGAKMRQIIKLRSLEVAGQTFTDVEAAIDDQPSASDINVGVNILRRFLITTDFPNHLVWLQPRT